MCGRKNRPRTIRLAAPGGHPKWPFEFLISRIPDIPGRWFGDACGLALGRQAATGWEVADYLLTTLPPWICTSYWRISSSVMSFLTVWAAPVSLLVLFSLARCWARRVMLSI